MTYINLLHKIVIIFTIILFSPVILISGLVLSCFRKTLLYLDSIIDEENAEKD